MQASHARPMTAYAALCAAAVVVLAQGVTTTTPGLADAIARVGEPAHRIAVTSTIRNAVAMSAGEQITELGAQIGATVAQAVAPVLASPETERSALADQPSSGVRRAEREPVTHTATAKQKTTGSSPQAHGKASTAPRGDHPVSGHAATRDALQRSGVAATAERTDSRTERKADRKVDRDAAKAERRAARGKHRR